YVQDITSTISEIHNQLEDVWAKEKKVLKESNKGEGKTLSEADIKQKIFSRISDINGILAANRKRVNSLERKLKETTTNYSGIQSMVDDLKKTLNDREKSVADLTARVQGLQEDLNARTVALAQRDTTIANQSRQLDDQTQRINTVFYVAGKRSDLKEKGVITREGGFLWGLLGSTTVLASNYDSGSFEALDKTREQEIKIPGKIDEIVPQRAEGTWAAQESTDGTTILKILKPEMFWRDSHLVIVED
ncbi:MAG TPA: hypothetical protein VMM37_04815, partial [Bacteroidota bacterium]|nr:hypothetical protein [Bacteroidota bacterium]